MFKLSYNMLVKMCILMGTTVVKSVYSSSLSRGLVKTRKKYI